MKKNKAKQGLIWSALERVGTQGIQLIIMLYLGRILGPNAFGLVGIISFFISLAQVLIDSGFSAALIRKSERSEKDFSTVFIFNVLLALIIYFGLFLVSGYIAAFYDLAQLDILLKVLALTIVINAFTIIPKVILTVNLDFKTQAKVSIFSILISSIGAVILAKMGYGVWALIAQSLIYSFLGSILLNVFQPWYPKVGFCYKSFKELFSFSSKLLISGILDSTFNNIYQLVIGKYFTPQLVGQFTQANQLSSIPAMTLTNIIQRVTYPIFCSMLNDKKKMDLAYFDTLKIASVIVFPVLLGIGIIAQPLLSIVLGKEWDLAAHMLMYLCFGYMLYPVHAINLNILQVYGRSDLFLKLEIIKKIALSIIIAITINYSISAMIGGMIFHSYLCLLLNGYFTQSVSSITLKMQIKSIAPIWMICVLNAFVTVKIVANLKLPLVPEIVSMIILNAVLYIISVRLLNKSLFNQIVLIVKK